MLVLSEPTHVGSRFSLRAWSPRGVGNRATYTAKCEDKLEGSGHGGAVSSVRVRDSPPPPPLPMTLTLTLTLSPQREGKGR